MKFKVALGKQTARALKKGVATQAELAELLKKFILKMDGKDININVEKMKGQWKGYYRIRAGNLRAIVRADFPSKTIEVIRIGPRGDVYK